MLANGLVNSSMQAIRIRSGVAGVSSGNHSVRPHSDLAAAIASLMAKNTEDARKKGGSPTALDECIALTFGEPCINQSLAFRINDAMYKCILSR